ncbi:MAG: hypothetical protein KAH07_00290, partial [Flavobacteriaceae bacterium]|nr:hypothetical protein [Flavobacteriaceae bacterium]
MKKTIIGVIIILMFSSQLNSQNINQLEFTDPFDIERPIDRLITTEGIKDILNLNKKNTRFSKKNRTKEQPLLDS